MLSLLELAEALHAECLPLDVAHKIEVRLVSSTRNADATSLVFAENEATLREALASKAAAALVTPELAATVPTPGKPLMLVPQPRLAFSKAWRLLAIVRNAYGVHPTAILEAGVSLAEGVSIGPYAVLGERVRIGKRTEIGAGCVLAEGVRIGDDCKLFPRVVIYAGVTLQDRVVVHAGCVLGSDGFGYVRDAENGVYTLFPQQGTLRIEDDVEIGANTTIDRGALEQTSIACGTKLDNLVHIGHNVRVGRNVVIAAQTGISGSSAVGNGAVLGGQVGVGEHAKIGEGVILGGGAGVLSKKKLRGEGKIFWGRPAQPLRDYLKDLATLARLTHKTRS